MSQLFFQWTRFWSTRDANINLDNLGFLVDPGINSISHAMNPDICILDDLVKKPCVILLGEPGSGKSTEIKRFAKITRDYLSESNAQVMEKSLSNYSSDSYLVRDIFESEEFLLWKQGEGDLFLFLDALDEGMLSISKIANIISNNLEKHASKRIFLRMACRSADWPKSLETSLISNWGEDNVVVLEIAPLRKKDIIDAANQNGIESQLFIDEISKKEVTPLASKPITLFFLIRTYQDQHCLPESKINLYEKGCEFLCEEPNPSRIDSKQVGELSAKERMVIAGRIATILLLTNNGEIDTSSTRASNSDDSLRIENLAGFTERIMGNELMIREREIIETIGTGLFSLRGKDHYGFVHQSYAEFLAAWYLNLRVLEFPQYLELLTQSYKGKNRIVPQLRELSAWLAAFSDHFFDFVLANDPTVLLQSDTSNLTDAQRSRIVEEILWLLENDQWFDMFADSFRKYQKLHHANLAAQLKDYILDKDRNISVRRTAVEIASACGVQSLQVELLAIALDSSEDIRIRRSASSFIQEVGNVDSKKKLLPLASGEMGDDPDDELKGIGLLAIWPEAIDTPTLLSLLTPVKTQNLYGSYRSFLYKLQSNLTEIDIFHALNWAIDQSKPENIPHEFEILIDNLIIKAWSDAESQRWMNQIARIIFLRLKHLKSIIVESSYLHQSSLISFNVSYRNETDKRHNLIQIIISLMVGEGKEDPTILTFSYNDLILEEDFFWILEKIIEPSDQRYKHIYAEIAYRLLRKEDKDQIDALYEVLQKEPSIKDSFVFIFGPIPFDTPYVQTLKRQYEYEQNLLAKSVEQLSPQDLVEELLGEFESGNMDAWWKINQALALSRNANSHDFFCDITKTAGWNESNEFTKKRILSAAKRYLEERDPETEKWFLTKSVNVSVVLGYRAFFLLYLIEPGFVKGLGKEIIEKWIPATVWMTSIVDEGDLQLHNRLLTVIYDISPQLTINCLDRLIDKENSADRNIFILSRITELFEVGLAEFLLRKLNDQTLFIDSFQAIIFSLLQREIVPAIELSLDYCKQLNSPDRSILEKAKVALKGLIIFTPTHGWPEMVSLLDSQVEICKEILLQTVQLRWNEKGNLTNFINEDQILIFSIWLFKNFPPEDDSKENHNDFHTITPNEELRIWRDRVIRDLANVGSFGSFQAIKKLSDEFPEIHWLKLMITDAGIIYRRNSWQHPNAEEVMKLIANPNQRLVQSNEQLLGVVIESLKRLQRNLNGETPEAQFLWNDISESKFRPKKENRLSDYVKIHLKKDIAERVIINREVEIRPPMPSSPGQNTDILINAFMETSNTDKLDNVSIIIETKCNWNNELLNNMKDQLVDRYLKENQCQIGIYLVGWYESLQWDTDDNRYQKCIRLSKVDIANRLENQASELSSDGNLIKFIMLDVTY